MLARHTDTIHYRKSDEHYKIYFTGKENGVKRGLVSQA